MHRSRRVLIAVGAAAVSLVAAVGPVGGATVAVGVADFSFTPAKVTAAQGGAAQWNFKGPSTHTATALMGLFNSGFKSSGTSYSFAFVAAGKYPYRCSIHSSMTGMVVVPLKVAPASGGSTTMFSVTWASGPLPANHVADVQIKRPGTTSFVSWKTSQTGRSSSFVPDQGRGTYSFQGRLRNTATAKASSYSPAASISVS